MNKSGGREVEALCYVLGSMWYWHVNLLYPALLCNFFYAEKPFINPLAPKSDQHLISRYTITPESHFKVMRIKEIITN